MGELEEYLEFIATYLIVLGIVSMVVYGPLVLFYGILEIINHYK